MVIHSVSEIQPLHSWRLDVLQARKIQQQLAPRVNLQTEPVSAKTVCGVDVAYHKGTDQLAAAAVVLDAETLQEIERAMVYCQTTFDYIPGLFSFREMPAVLKALDQLSKLPDLIVCDGHGYAHPKQFGLACHLGLWLNTPTIGCAKKRLTGTYNPVGAKRGNFQPLNLDQQLVGHALRTQDNVKEVFVSPGHKIGFTEARQWILRLSPNYRLPETSRAADRLANQLRSNLT